MNDVQPQVRRPDTLLGWMDGLAEPTRLRILRVLDGRELSVLELCEVLALPQSTVSRHLKVLAERGWLASRRAGTQSLYGFAERLPSRARRIWELARDEAASWPLVKGDAERLRAVKTRQAQRFFAGAAAAWQKLRADVYGPRLELEALLALVPHEWTVADLGCGTGALATELAPHVRKIVAVDQSAAMLRTARKVLAAHGNVEIHEAPLEALPLPDQSCDAAIASLALAYLDDPTPALREALRILRPAGRLVVVEAARHEDLDLKRRLGQAHAGFDAEGLEALLRQAGFSAISSRVLPPEPGAKGPGLVVVRASRPAAERND
jgi:ArsR family transcriptional regulator